MAITKMTDDLNIIQALADLPNDTDGLTPAQLKAKFDEAVNLLKTYLNDTLIAELESTTDGSSGADRIGATALNAFSGETVQAILEYLKTQIDNTVLGQIPDGSVTEVKLSFDLATQTELNAHLADETNPHNVTANQLGAINILNEIKTVDGAGSGLDADLFDGKHANDFMNATKIYGSATYTDSILPNTTLTKSIPLGGNYQTGRLVVGMKGYGTRYSVAVWFGTDPLKTIASGYVFIQSGSSFEWGAAWHRSRQSSVTNPYIYNQNIAGYYSTGNLDIYIVDIYISGANLIIQFKNNNGSLSKSLSCDVNWEVW